MKSNQTKGKLMLRKQVITRLSNTDQSRLKAGNQEAVITTSYVRCTGFTCCERIDDTTWVTIFVKTLL